MRRSIVLTQWQFPPETATILATDFFIFWVGPSATIHHLASGCVAAIVFDSPTPLCRHIPTRFNPCKFFNLIFFFFNPCIRFAYFSPFLFWFIYIFWFVYFSHFYFGLFIFFLHCSAIKGIWKVNYASLFGFLFLFSNVGTVSTWSSLCFSWNFVNEGH